MLELSETIIMTTQFEETSHNTRELQNIQVKYKHNGKNYLK